MAQNSKFLLLAQVREIYERVVLHIKSMKNVQIDMRAIIENFG